jgi:hypothetical protein
MSFCTAPLSLPDLNLCLPIFAQLLEKLICSELRQASHFAGGGVPGSSERGSISLTIAGVFGVVRSYLLVQECTREAGDGQFKRDADHLMSREPVLQGGVGPSPAALARAGLVLTARWLLQENLLDGYDTVRSSLQNEVPEVVAWLDAVHTVETGQGGVAVPLETSVVHVDGIVRRQVEDVIKWAQGLLLQGMLKL